jgi:hypothetical protein
MVDDEGQAHSDAFAKPQMLHVSSMRQATRTGPHKTEHELDVKVKLKPTFAHVCIVPSSLASIQGHTHHRTS